MASLLAQAVEQARQELAAAQRLASSGQLAALAEHLEGQPHAGAGQTQHAPQVSLQQHVQDLQQRQTQAHAQALEQQALAAELLRLLVARERVCAEGLSEQQRRFAWEQANPTRRAWHQLEQELEGPELLVPPLEAYPELQDEALAAAPPHPPPRAAAPPPEPQVVLLQPVPDLAPAGPLDFAYVLPEQGAGGGVVAAPLTSSQAEPYHLLAAWPAQRSQPLQPLTQQQQRRARLPPVQVPPAGAVVLDPQGAVIFGPPPARPQAPQLLATAAPPKQPVYAADVAMETPLVEEVDLDEAAPQPPEELMPVEEEQGGEEDAAVSTVLPGDTAPQAVQGGGGAVLLRWSALQLKGEATKLLVPVAGPGDNQQPDGVSQWEEHDYNDALWAELGPVAYVKFQAWLCAEDDPWTLLSGAKGPAYLLLQRWRNDPLQVVGLVEEWQVVHASERRSIEPTTFFLAVRRGRAAVPADGGDGAGGASSIWRELRALPRGNAYGMRAACVQFFGLSADDVAKVSQRRLASNVLVLDAAPSLPALVPALDAAAAGGGGGAAWP